MSTSAPFKRRTGRVALTAVLLAGTALGGFAAGHTSYAATPLNDNVPAATTSGVPDFANLVDHVKPAVVSVNVKMMVSQADDEDGQEMPFGGMQMGPRGQQRHAVEARGSGFIVDANGIIVTNNHVVKNAKRVSVVLDDGTELPAKVLGRDPRSDLAVLKVDAGHKLPFIQLGDSDTVRPGQWVVAMGNPFGLGGTVTAGIVSARGRDIGAGPYDEFIQIDAPINQGNSGGPLFTQDGKVVGVNTAILSPSGGSVGIGFAIPASLVKDVVAQLEADGHVSRGYLGVQVQPLDAKMAKALQLPADSGGALIAGVEPDAPAAKAGLKAGDIVTAVDGKKVTNPRELALDVANVKPGDTAKLDVIQDGNAKTINVALGDMPNDQTADRGAAGEHQARGKVGVALTAITPDIRNQLQLPESTKGAVVANVQPGSPAEAAGLKPGDVITGVGTQAVASPAEAVKAIGAASKSKDQALALRVMRDGHSAFVAVDLTAQADAQG